MSVPIDEKEGAKAKQVVYSWKEKIGTRRVFDDRFTPGAFRLMEHDNPKDARAKARKGLEILEQSYE